MVDDHTVFVTHSPAYGVLDTGVMDLPSGSVSIRELIERTRPILHIHGHIHQQFGNRGRHFNVAAAGHKRAVVIDTDTLRYEVVSKTAI
jgi:Icc-related predicted phosphoesterase